MQRAMPTNLFAEAEEASERRSVLRRMERRKWLWIALLTVGFWFARPYYFPWTAAEEADADTRATAAQGSVERQVAMPMLSLLAVYMLWRSPTARRFKGKLMGVGIGYCLVSGASLAWSVDPSTTLRRLTVFFMCVLVIAAMARALTVMDLARLAFYGGGACALIGMFVDVFITHAFAPLDPNYRFMGIMSSNSQGQNLTVCIFSGLALLIKYPERRRWMIPALGLATVMLYVTRSRTSTFLCIVLGLVFVKRLLDQRYGTKKRMVIGFAVVGVLGAALISFGNAQAAQDAVMLGREDTQNNASLSNRAPLWAELADYVAIRPVLGYGYNAFWTSDRILRISKDQGWPVPNAHNTYLDQQLSSGVFGLLLFTGMFWGGVVLAWVRFKKRPAAETLLPAAVLTWLVVTSFVETVPVDPFMPTLLAYVFLAQLMLERVEVVRVPSALAA